MKAIIISIKPKWCALIMNDKKFIEVRTSNALAKAIQKLIDKYGYAEIHVYCTKDEELYKFSWNKTWYENFKHFADMGCDQAHALDSDNLNGKVLFKFRCYKVEKIINKCVSWDTFEGGNEIFERSTQSLSEKELQKLSCLSYDDLDDYLGWCKEGIVGCAIHISDLEIFDRPRELCEFMTPKQHEKYQRDLEQAIEEDEYTLSRLYSGDALEDECANSVELLEMTKDCYGLKKAPQSWCYVEVEE